MKSVLHRLRRILLALAFAVILPAALLPQAQESRKEWNEPVPPFRIIGNIYYVGAAEIASYMIVTPSGEIVLDGGFPETAPQIEANIQKLGFKLTDVKILLNSHAHFDHAGGLAELKKRTGARLAAMDGDAAVLAKGDTNLLPPVAPDRILHDLDTVNLGGVKMTAHLTPGHTRGCTTWTMTTEDSGEKYNVVFVCSSTVLHDYRLVNDPTYPGIAADYEKSFRILKSLPCDVFLAPHGSFFNLEDKRKELASGAKKNPFIDPVGYQEYVARSEADYRAALDRERAQPSDRAKPQ
jgi:metallo-beta-lactamase class B